MNQNKGILYAFIAVLLWATLGIGFKLAVSRLDSFAVTIYIGFFATLFLFLYLILKGKINKVWQVFKNNWLFFIIIGIIGLGIQQILYLKGYQLLPASNVVIIFYLYPLLMLLISTLFFKEKTSPISYLFILMGFIGLYILISKGTLLDISLNLGIIVTLFAALSWAIFSVFIKYKEFDVDIGMFLFNLFGLIFLICLIPIFGFTWNITNYEFLGMIYLGIFPTAIAFIFWNKALQTTQTHICSNIALLTPLFSIILIVAVLKETIIISQIIAMILILGSVLLNLKFGKK